jgi:hypothetical protein
MKLPDNIDPALWFTTEKDGLRFYFYKFSPHTFTGRMYAFDPHEFQSFCVSKNEIVDLSRESEYFIVGFLAGNEPPPPSDENGPLIQDDPRMQRYREVSAQFREDGFWDFARINELE